MTATEEWTRFQCADHWGIKPDTWSGYVTRGQAPAPARHVGRTPVWDAETVRTWNRPGSGARTDLRSPAVMLPPETTAHLKAVGDKVDRVTDMDGGTRISFRNGHTLTLRAQDGGWVCTMNARLSAFGDSRPGESAPAEAGDLPAVIDMVASEPPNASTQRFS